MPWKTCASWLRSVNFGDRDQKNSLTRVARAITMGIFKSGTFKEKMTLLTRWTDYQHLKTNIFQKNVVTDRIAHGRRLGIGGIFIIPTIPIRLIGPAKSRDRPLEQRDSMDLKGRIKDKPSTLARGVKKLLEAKADPNAPDCRVFLFGLRRRILFRQLFENTS